MLNRTERKKFSNLTKLIVFCAIPLLSLSTMAKTIIYVANSDTPSVSVFQLELSSGNLIRLQQQLLPNLVKLGPSSPMLITPNKQNLLVVNRGEPKVIFNFLIQAKSGQLSLKSKTALPASMANISTDKTGKLLLAASYPQHLLSVHSLSEQGDVLPQQQVLTDLPNAHASLINKDNRFVFVPALGSDQIRQFKLNLETGQLSPNTPSAFQLEANTGPRHLVEHPNKNMVYLLGEYDAAIHVFEYQSTAGTLAKIQQIETAQTDSLKVNGLKHPNQDTSKAKRFWAADIHITPKGDYVYASERNSSSLSAFRVDPDTGKLTYIDSFETDTQPRGFSINPSGQFLISAGQVSNTISIYKIEQNTGRLTSRKTYPVGDNPNWIEIVNLN